MPIKPTNARFVTQGEILEIAQEIVPFLFRDKAVLSCRIRLAAEDISYIHVEYYDEAKAPEEKEEVLNEEPTMTGTVFSKEETKKMLSRIQDICNISSLSEYMIALYVELKDAKAPASFEIQSLIERIETA